MNVNRWRNLALVFMFGGFFVIYCGVYDRTLLPYLLAIGTVGLLIGILLYFRFGPVNPTVHQIQCPRCGSDIRVVGDQDACNRCRQALRRDDSGNYEPYVPTSS